MSTDTWHKMARNAKEIEDMLSGLDDDLRSGVPMPFLIAVATQSKLRGIQSMADAVEEEVKDERKRALEIIEGLLENWPHTEVVSHYSASHASPVLTRDEALRRASSAVKNKFF